MWRAKTVLIWINHRVLIEIRVNYCALSWIASKERVCVQFMWSEVNTGTYIVCFNIQGLWIVFRYYLAGTKTWQELLSGIIFCHGETFVTGEREGELERIFNSWSITVKRSVIDRFIYLHCLKCVPVKVTYLTKCKGFYSF